MKLINANNALAAVDYIAALPFVSYGTRVLSDFGKVIPNNVFGQTVVMPRFTNWKTKGLWKSLVENYKTDVSLAQQLSRLTPELQQTVLNGAKMQAAYDGRVFEFAKNLIKTEKVPIFVTMIVGTIDSTYGKIMTGNTGLNVMPTIVHPSTFARCVAGT